MMAGESAEGVLCAAAAHTTWMLGGICRLLERVLLRLNCDSCQQCVF